jgi:hypothetical protein
MHGLERAWLMDGSGLAHGLPMLGGCLDWPNVSGAWLMAPVMNWQALAAVTNEETFHLTFNFFYF